MNSRIIKLFWIAIEKFGATIISVCSFMFYAKFLTPEEFGLAIIALSIGQGCSLIIGSLFEDALIQAKDKNNIYYNTAFWYGNFISIIVIAMTSVICYLIVDDMKLFYLIEMSLISITLVSSTTPYIASLRCEGKFNVIAKRVIISRVIATFIGIAMVSNHAGSISLVVQSILGDLFGLMILFHSHRTLKLGLKTDLNIFKKLARVGVLLCIRRLSWDLTVRGVPLVLGGVSGAVAVGNYGFAWRLVEMPRSAIVSGLMSYALPVFSRRQSNYSALIGLYKKTTCFVSIFFTPLFIGLAAVAPTFIPLVFGDKWIDAVLPTQVFAITATISVTRMFANVSFTAVGKPNVALLSDVIGSVVVIAITGFVADDIGVAGAALAMLVRSFLVYPFSLQGFKRIFGLSWYGQLKPVSIPIISVVIMTLSIAGIGHYIDMDSLLLDFLTQCTIGAFFYIVTIFTLFPNVLSEMKVFLNGKENE
jgi:O-antigen/teichoic acid export membrane protein